MKIVWMFYDRENYTGGPTINAVRLLPELQKRGHEVYALVAYLGEEKVHPNADVLVKEGISCRITKFPAYTEDFVKWILVQVKEIDPDIFVPNISVAGCFAGKWIKTAGIPVVSTVRSEDRLNVGMAEFFHFLDKEWRLSGLVSVNNYLIEKLQSEKTRNPDLRHKIIPSGVDIPEFRSNQNEEKLKIAYAGRLESKQKKFPETFDLFVDISKMFSEVEFQIFGEGKEDQKEYYIQKAKQLGLSEKFTFHGSLAGQEYKRELSKCHILVLLSAYEGMPGALMDAMSAGLIPIAFNFNGVTEIIEQGKNGFIVENRKEAVVDILKKILGDHINRQHISENAIETIKKNFTLEETVGRWEAFFEELISKNIKMKLSLPKRLKLPAPDQMLPEYKIKPSWKLKLYKRIKLHFA